MLFLWYLLELNSERIFRKNGKFCFDFVNGQDFDDFKNFTQGLESRKVFVFLVLILETEVSIFDYKIFNFLNVQKSFGW